MLVIHAFLNDVFGRASVAFAALALWRRSAIAAYLALTVGTWGMMLYNFTWSGVGVLGGALALARCRASGAGPPAQIARSTAPSRAHACSASARAAGLQHRLRPARPQAAPPRLPVRRSAVPRARGWASAVMTKASTPGRNGPDREVAVTAGEDQTEADVRAAEHQQQTQRTRNGITSRRVGHERAHSEQVGDHPAALTASVTDQSIQFTLPSTRYCHWRAPTATSSAADAPNASPGTNPVRSNEQCARQRRVRWRQSQQGPDSALRCFGHRAVPGEFLPPFAIVESPVSADGAFISRSSTADRRPRSR